MKFEAALGENVKFEPKSYEIYGPLRDKDDPKNMESQNMKT
jgi:hypothetical protein